MPYLRTVKTKLGARRRHKWCSVTAGVTGGSQHLGSAHDDAEAEGAEGCDAAVGSRRGAATAWGLRRPLPITSSWIGCLLDALDRADRVLGHEDATGGDVFRHLVQLVRDRPGRRGRGSPVPEMISLAAKLAEMVDMIAE